MSHKFYMNAGIKSRNLVSCACQRRKPAGCLIAGRRGSGRGQENDGRHGPVELTEHEVEIISRC